MLTLEEEKRLVILFAIEQLGGAARKSDVLNWIEACRYWKFSSRDREVMETRREEVWRNDFAFVRKHLVQLGLEADLDAPVVGIALKQRPVAKPACLVANRSRKDVHRLDLAVCPHK